jgi:arylformamidase
MRRVFLKSIVGFASLGTAALANLMPANRTAAAAGLAGDVASSEFNEPTESGPFELPAGARLERDLPYGNDPLQRLDVYHPAAATGAPLIFMVHGGGWTRGNKALWRVVKNKVNHWVGTGYIFVSTNYRMAPAADPVAQADDVAKALAFAQSRLKSWGGDPSRVIVMGHSSGAHLVALLTADPSIAARQGAAPWLASVLLDSAAMNVEQLMSRRHLGLYDQVFKNDPKYWRLASPTLRLEGKPVAPMLAVCSTRRLDSCPQARAFAAKAARFGGRVEVLPVDFSHPEINAYLGTQGAYTEGVDAFLKSLGKSTQ